MRCKNCGSENDDNLYICQNCGSPLYDEDDIAQENDVNSTRVFKTVNTPDDGYDEPVRRSNIQKDKEEEKKKQTIIIIAVLAVILVAIIAGTIIAVAHNNKADNTTSSQSSDPSDEASGNYNDNYNNDNDLTSQQSTSEKTTESTTEKTTESTTKETTTKIKTFSVSLSCNDGGEVEGDGTYKRGENVTIIARPDDGYAFDGWYNGDKKVSSNTKYTFTVTDNTNLQAVFVIVNDEPIDNLDGGED